MKHKIHYFFIGILGILLIGVGLLGSLGFPQTFLVLSLKGQPGSLAK
jgi:hypothetical protein